MIWVDFDGGVCYELGDDSFLLQGQGAETAEQHRAMQEAVRVLVLASGRAVHALGEVPAELHQGDAIRRALRPRRLRPVARWWTPSCCKATRPSTSWGA